MHEPSLQNDGWCLQDAENHQAEYPTTFHIPPLEIRTILQPGDFAKLMFAIAVADHDDPQVERMWVIVRARKDGGYIGILDNQPASVEPDASFQRGIELPFKPNHIIDVKKRNAKSIAIAKHPTPNQ